MFIKSIFGILILIVILISGCLNSNEPTQKTQQIITPTTPTITPVPTPTIKIIDLHAQQLVIDVNDIKEALGQDWKTSGGGFVIDVSKLNPKSIVNPTYESEPLKRNGGSIQYYAMVQVVVFKTITEAKRANEVGTNIGEANPSITNIGDYRVQTSDGNIIIKFVRNNVVTYIWINRAHWPGDDGQEFLSDTDKTEMLSIDKAINLAKKQDAKISKILDMIEYSYPHNIW